MGDVCEVETRIQSVKDRDSDHSLNIHALRRFRYYSCQRFRDINDHPKLVQSRHRPSRPKIQCLLQQVSSFKYPFRHGEFTEIHPCFNQSTPYHVPRIVSSLYHTLKTL